MRPFTPFVIVLLFLATVSGQQQQQQQQQQQPPPSPPAPVRGHHGPKQGHHRRNAAKFFGYVRTNKTAYMHNHTVLAEEFMHAHNWVRKEYQLPAFAWDENLASFARQYLMERYEDCKLVHSSANYGENMFWGKRLHWTPSDAVYYWYLEKQWYDFKTLKCMPTKSCEHFTQIVWRDSARLGCALQHCQHPGTGMLIACEYDPPGNYADENPLEAHS